MGIPQNPNRNEGSILAKKLDLAIILCYNIRYIYENKDSPSFYFLQPPNIVRSNKEISMKDIWDILLGIALVVFMVNLIWGVM